MASTVDVIADTCRKGLIRHPNHPAVIAGAKQRSFAELDERASRLAHALADWGLSRGDRFALLATNVIEFPEIEIAAQRAGLILVPLNYRLAVAELSFMVADSGARLVIHGPGYAEAAKALGLACWHLGADGYGDSYEQQLATHQPRATPPLGQQTPTRILYTSGTTGRPKGAVLTNLALYARATTYAIDLELRPEHRFVQTLPMFHIASNTAMGFIYNGATVILTDFEPHTVLDAMATHRATHVLLVPTTINLLSNLEGIDERSFPDLEMMMYGASPIAPAVLARAIEVFGCKFFQFFGMTETSGCTVLLPEHHDPVRRPDLLASAGIDATGFETRVVGPDDVEAAPGEVGEIVCRGPQLMAGYWQRPEATEDAMRNGWMHTGDAGYRSAEGFVFVTDRIKDMIVSGGENVYPREVEDVLFSHPEVVEAAVIGVPDARWGERVHAVVVTRPGSSVDSASLLAYARERLAGYKCPKSLEFVESLPKTVTGKVLKTDLRAPHWVGVSRSVG
jgi:long-chain acyl-CoA synthetase